MPQPISALSPTRPGALPAVPPVDVGGDGAVPVQGYRADRAADRAALGPLGVALALAVGDERRGIALGDARRPGEGERPVAHQEDVAAGVEDMARERDGIGDARDRRDGAALQPVPLHDRRVHLDHPVTVEDRAASGVELRVVLERAHGGLDGVERGATRREDPPAGEGRRAHAPAKLLAPLARVGAGAAVNDERGHPRRGGAFGR